MESWPFYIWIKRLAPIVLIALVVGGYYSVTYHLETKAYQADYRVAEVTARLWIAGAKYRSDPDRYRTYRDSLLMANGIPDSLFEHFPEKFDEEPDKYFWFSATVSHLVDSLYQVEESSRRAVSDSASDSTAAPEIP